VSTALVLARLEERVRAALDPTLVAGRQVRVVGRSDPLRSGKRYMVEYVDVEMDDERLALFAKHGPAVDHHDQFKGGMPGGLSYEARAHDLARSTDPAAIVPRYGLFVDPAGQATLLFARVPLRTPRSSVPEPAVATYASWLGAFQRTAGEPGTMESSGIFRLDDGFLWAWLERATDMIGELGIGVLPPGLRTAYADDVHQLTMDPVLLHGDLYSDNVLVAADGSIRVVDWELAAIGAGEIDLATLILGRGEHVQRRCIDAYSQCRFGTTVPSLLERRVLAATRYVLLRILSIRPRPERLKRYRRRVRLLSELVDPP
jgi:hypothetical protein